ncbi:hypothetical protein P1J78_02655 [Psychromarinibacter sp. C21-152]|uniref:ATP-grasp domain-containing protein n=1 Tax=Psychromarinibacter sediminicola TaxID=3033385 RepID=A0AAE3NLR2_9RHOB|nr:hypothetical protein [Psychromarinibacter sediminicola]MDF0599623.1 hypothetical protein [Psychromarinibacter sediminicola]
MSDLRIPTGLDPSVPVLALGGEANAVEMARNLARYGIEVRVCGTRGCYAIWSRDVAEALPVPAGVAPHDYWAALLLSPDGSRFAGHVVMAMDDDAIAFVIAHADALRARYRLERFDTRLRADMLDKARTIELAAQADVPAPRHWRVSDPADLPAIRDALTFPVMVKPIHTWRFVQAFGRKLFIVEDSYDEVVEKVALAAERGLEVMVVEMIPGPDSLLSSYYTFIGDDGRPQFHYTKRVLRRLPANRGPAVYHVSEWLPETAEAGLRYLQGIGWRGLANIEFKRDPRDGRLKVIEINTRLTAAHRLLVRAGVPTDLFVYCDATGQPGPSVQSYRQGLTLWYPLRDVRAFLELNRAGKLTLRAWLGTLPVRRLMLPLFSLRDPLPSLARAAETLGGLRRRLWSRGA